MGESGREWEDVFDGIPIHDQMKRRRRIAYHVGESTMTLDDRDDMIADLMDETIQFSQEDLDAFEMLAKMNARRPVDNYAPSQKEIGTWIRSFVDL